MLRKNQDKKREQIQFVSPDMLVPEDHLLRDIDRFIDFSFIYDLVEEVYSPDQGRPSLDPVMLLKIPLLQALYGITSMRQTIQEIQVNSAYRWFLGLDLTEAPPHFSTFGKNYKRRFEGTDLFEQIFQHILQQCMKQGLVDPSILMIDATHIKANANKRKVMKAAAKKTALFYEEELRKEIDADRASHGKKPLRDKDDDDRGSGMKEVTQSTTDPESGMFHKGEHKKDLAYVTQTACDKHGWVLAYSIHPGNEHDSRTFHSLYQKVKDFDPSMVVLDAGYKTPAIARELLEHEIVPLLPYTAPKGKKGFFRTKDFIYDEYYDCYLCPENQVLSYATTNKHGRREYKSQCHICEKCPSLTTCTESKNCTKIVGRHVWEDYMETCEDIRHTRGMKDIYGLRKETIERIFGTAKEYHGLRFTRLIGKAAMEMKVGLVFTCMNIKKLVKTLKKREDEDSISKRLSLLIHRYIRKKEKLAFSVC